MIGLVALIFLPVIVMVTVFTKPVGPDISDLTPVTQHSDEYLILAWPELERGKRSLSAGGISSGTMIRALGYMMDGDRPIRDGEHVRSFVLLPDAGTLVHPAHRFGDQMIEVRLATGDTVPFSEQSLVWVWGTLRMLPGDPLGPKPLNILENARTEPATKVDIQKYFN